MQHWEQQTVGRPRRCCLAGEAQRLHLRALGDLGPVTGKGVCGGRLLGGALNCILLALSHTCKPLQGTQGRGSPIGWCTYLHVADTCGCYSNLCVDKITPAGPRSHIQAYIGVTRECRHCGNSIPWSDPGFPGRKNTLVKHSLGAM